MILNSRTKIERMEGWHDLNSRNKIERIEGWHDFKQPEQDL
jgi:hypothetical protein